MDELPFFLTRSDAKRNVHLFVSDDFCSKIFDSKLLSEHSIIVSHRQPVVEHDNRFELVDHHHRRNISTTFGTRHDPDCTSSAIRHSHCLSLSPSIFLSVFVPL